MIDTRLANNLRNLIVKKMGNSYECSIEDKDIKEEFFISSRDGGRTYSLYRGCDLEIGDVPLMSVVNSICSLHQELTKVSKNLYIGKWGGSAKAYIINDLSLIPQGSRYVGTLDDNTDIYETDNGVVYGVVA
jgi:hypothetical protein